MPVNWKRAKRKKPRRSGAGYGGLGRTKETSVLSIPTAVQRSRKAKPRRGETGLSWNGVPERAPALVKRTGFFVTGSPQESFWAGGGSGPHHRRLCSAPCLRPSTVLEPSAIGWRGACLKVRRRRAGLDRQYGQQAEIRRHRQGAQRVPRSILEPNLRQMHPVLGNGAVSHVSVFTLPDCRAVNVLDSLRRPLVSLRRIGRGSGLVIER
jgi:hypothetical protein